MTLAVSACLLGHKVRFDGGHKHDRFITDALGQYADFTTFCPEDRAFATPRPSLRLVGEGESLIVESNKTKEDLTLTLQKAVNEDLALIEETPLCGIIFKSRSPSCGLGSAKRYLKSGMNDGKTDGLFAKACRDAFVLLPMEEEGRLQDPWLRENFVMAIFAYDAFETFKASSPHMHDLVAFHTKNKFMLQAKDELLYRKMGNIIANHQQKPFEEVFNEYELTYKMALTCKSSIKRNRNVLEHMAGFFKKELSLKEKSILHEQIRDYAAKIVPLITPLSTIKLFAQKYETSYLLDQRFLEPYPKELALRSHIASGK